MDGSPSRLVRLFMGVYPTDRRSSLIRKIYMCVVASDGWRGPLLVTTAAFIFAGANAAAHHDIRYWHTRPHLPRALHAAHSPQAVPNSNEA